MNCERAIALISARIDGELSPADAAALEAHLADCPACAATAEAFELQDADMRHAFDDRRHQAGAVAERVAEQLPRHAAPAGRWKRLAAGPAPTSSAPPSRPRVAGLTWLLGVHSNPPTAPTPPASAGAEPLEGPHRPAEAARAGAAEARRRPDRRPPSPASAAASPCRTARSSTSTRTRRVTLDEERHLTPVRPARSSSRSHRGRPKASARFVVQTPQREVTALGTKFAVQAGDGEAGVLVTQGNVMVSGLDGRHPRGPASSPADGSRRRRPAPRTCSTGRAT